MGTKTWTFADDYPRVGGLSVTVRRPTAAEEREIAVATSREMSHSAVAATVKRATSSAGVTGYDAISQVARDCVVKIGDREIRDDERDDMWEEQLDGWARADLVDWVRYCTSPPDDRPQPFLD